MSSFENIQTTFNNALHKIDNGLQSMLTDTKEKFDQNKPKNNIFNYVNSINNDELFIYLLLIAAIVFVSSTITFNSSVIIGLILACIVIYFLRERKIALGDNFEMEHETKLEHDIFSTTKNMHIDASIIDLLFSIKEYKNYNPEVFMLLTKHIDNLLRIETDLEKGTMYPYHMLDVAKTFHKKTLNALHSMVHSIPYSNNSDKKHTRILEEFNILLAKHMSKIKYLADKIDAATPINTASRPKYDDKVSGQDSIYEQNYEFFS